MLKPERMKVVHAFLYGIAKTTPKLSPISAMFDNSKLSEFFLFLS